MNVIIESNIYGDEIHSFLFYEPCMMIFQSIMKIKERNSLNIKFKTMPSQNFIKFV